MIDTERADMVALRFTVRCLLATLSQEHRDAIKAASIGLSAAFQERTDTPHQIGGARLQDAVERLFAPLAKKHSE